jgi:predicted helicase
MLQPRPHQLPAIAALAGHARAWVMMACGTGKTLVARHAAYAEAGPTGLIVVFSPSKRLNRQNRDAWVADTSEPMDVLTVYSDPDGTTSPHRIAEFMRSHTGRRRVVFCTYQSAIVLYRLYQINRDIPPFDVMVEDEAHLTASMEGVGYGIVLRDELIPARTRYAFTATPRVHTDPEHGTSAVASMDNESVYGPCVHQLTFGKAISDHLINDFRVVIITVTDADIHRLLENAHRDDSLSSAVLAAQVAMAHAIRDYGLNSALAFHSRVDRSRAYTNSLAAICKAVGTGPVVGLHMDGDTSARDRDTMLRRLAKPTPGTCTVLSSVRTISEGVDVPAIQAVQFADPRTEPAAVAQAVGRALRRNPAKVGIEQDDEEAEAAIVVLPVYLAPGDDPESILLSSKFAAVWSVLAALRDYDERLDSELAKASMQAVKVSLRSPKPVALPDRVHLKPTGMDALPPGLAEKLRTALAAHVMSLGNRRPKSPPVNTDLVWRLVSQWQALRNSDEPDAMELEMDVAREMREAVNGDPMNRKIPDRAYTYVAAMLDRLKIYERHHPPVPQQEV